MNPKRPARGFSSRGQALSSALLGTLLLLGGCVSSDSQEDPTRSDVKPIFREPAAPRPWTSDFREPALLIANRVYIEGPQGLLDHVATRSLDEYHSYEAKTLPEGFCQTYQVLRPASGVELRTYLDALEVVVFNELVVIEKPGDIDVSVRAQGDAYWRDTVTGKEKRSFEINLSGVIQRPK